MMNFLKKLFGSKPAPASPRPAPPKPSKPPIPQEELDAFKAWFASQTRPAIAFKPAPDRPVAEHGSRLGGPAWLADGEDWPKAANGVPLELVFQLDCADCATLDGYPADTILQFFVGRGDVYGCDFDDLVNGDFLVHARHSSDNGSLHTPPSLEEANGEFGNEYSPFLKMDVRQTGLMLDPQQVDDRMDYSIDGLYDHVLPLQDKFDLAALDAWLDSEDGMRPHRHHTGGYPAFTQADITETSAGKPFDHVLLRVTSDENVMWGDVGECVFLIRSADLRKGDFSRVAYSWDCH